MVSSDVKDRIWRAAVLCAWLYVLSAYFAGCCAFASWLHGNDLGCGVSLGVCVICLIDAVIVMTVERWRIEGIAETSADNP